MDSTLKLPVMQGCVSYTLDLSLLARQMMQLLLTKLGFWKNLYFVGSCEVWEGSPCQSCIDFLDDVEFIFFKKYKPWVTEKKSVLIDKSEKEKSMGIGESDGIICE